MSEERDLKRSFVVGALNLNALLMDCVKHLGWLMLNACTLTVSGFMSRRSVEMQHLALFAVTP
jgi:hypothetical protein